MKQIRLYLSIVFFFSLFLSFMACEENEDNDIQGIDSVLVDANTYADTIRLEWETPADLKTPESVKYDSENNILYVANINGKPTDIDGNGFISKVSTEGKILDLEWAVGLNAPKGMGIFEGHLYVTDINRLVKISIKTGEIINEYSADAQFLNDIDIDNNGNVYVTDMASDRIFKLSKDTFELWIQSEKFVRPNGLFVNDTILLVGTNPRILSVDISTKEITTFIDSTGGIDGIESVGNGQYVFSDWSGHINLSNIEKGFKLILNTAQDTIQAADIEYCSNKDLILVPTFYHNTVSAYKVVRK